MSSPRSKTSGPKPARGARGAGPSRGARRAVPAAETRDRLIGATLRLLATRSVAGVSVRDIAAEAGVNHGLVHRYFGAKDELIRAAVEHASRQVYGGDPPARTSWFVAQLRAHPEMAILVARACLDGPGELLGYAAPPPALLDALVDRLGPVVDRLPPLPGGARVDPRVVNALWTAALLGWHVFRPMLAAGYRLPVDADDQLAAIVRAIDRMLDTAA
jgi:TetR/AcrR family transcriptional regulator, repressor for neighboring sulfatase